MHRTVGIRRRRLRRFWHRYRRRRLTYWLSVGLVLGAMLVSWSRTMSTASTTRSQWSAREAVAVAVGDLDPGDLVNNADVARRDLPPLLLSGVPLEDPVGRTVTEPILSGEPFVEERLAPSGEHGASALVPDGTRGVAVPIDDATPPLEVGDRVELLATYAPDSVRQVLDGPITTGSVVAVHEHTVTVAVPTADTATTAFTLANGAVVLALLP